VPGLVPDKAPRRGATLEGAVPLVNRRSRDEENSIRAIPALKRRAILVAPLPGASCRQR